VRYVTPEIVGNDSGQSGQAMDEGSKVDATVLFVDIRGFYQPVRKRRPGAVVDLLNDYLRLG